MTPRDFLAAEVVAERVAARLIIQDAALELGQLKRLSPAERQVLVLREQGRECSYA